MDHQKSLKPINTVTSFLWGIPAYSLSYWLVKVADLSSSRSNPSTMGMPIPDFSELFVIFLTLPLAFIFLMVFKRPSVEWVVFALAGLAGTVTGMVVLIFTSFFMLSIPRALNDWLERYPILIALMFASPFYLSFGAIFARIIYDKRAIPFILKLFGIASPVLTLVGALILEFPMIKTILISILPDLDLIPPTMMLLLLMVAPLCGTGMALYNQRLNTQPET